MSTRKEKMRAAAAALVLELALAYALVTGLAIRPAHVVTEPLKILGLLPPAKPLPPPPPKPPAPRLRTAQREGAASPPNIRSTPTEIVAPPAIIPLPALPPIVAAPRPGPGIDPSAGAAPIAGPGTGSGGVGNGSGSGSGGAGPGGGGDGSPPEWLKGRIRDRDYPRPASEAGVGGIVEVTFRVDPDGRARDCWISKSSGNRDLDGTTCRLIEDRFRYRPARDRSGHPVRAWLVEEHEWVIDPVPPDDPRK